MEILTATDPHFVRCILPNRAKRPGAIESETVLEQLRCNGVLEGIRITRKGFPNRVAYAEFLQRYYLLVPNLARTSADPRQSVETLINQLHIDKEKYQFGLSKIFFRTGAVCANDQRVLSLSLSFARSFYACSLIDVI